MTTLTKLTLDEMNDLQQHELVIQRGKEQWFTVGMALRDIKERRLYRSAYTSFEEYLEKRWSISRSRAYQLISGVDVAETVSEQTTPSERQARELAKIDDVQERKEVWSGEPTSSKILEHVAKQKPAPMMLMDDQGCVVPKDMLEIFHDKQRFDEICDTLKRAADMIEQLSQRESSHYIKRDSVMEDIGNAVRSIQFARPSVVVQKSNSAPLGFWCVGQYERLVGAS